MKEETQKISLNISHHQIQIRSQAFDENLCQWGDGNVEQGAIIHPGYVTFDPLLEGNFEAEIWLVLNEQFSLDRYTQRCFVVPFEVLEQEKLEVLSVGTVIPIQLPLQEKKRYDLYYEVCENENTFYKLTFVPAEVKILPMMIQDDDWGGERNRNLKEGYVNI
ncbi:competence protein ComJ [Paenibacillus sp. FA6]|uniref:competence protein ComJ n=1 Tax=Paenibacillus sp. FA6 TaxID=3413029 RepID=UPI003F6572D5